jgi:hypothetical protein
VCKLIAFVRHQGCKTDSPDYLSDISMPKCMHRKFNLSMKDLKQVVSIREKYSTTVGVDALRIDRPFFLSVKFFVGLAKQPICIICGTSHFRQKKDS